MYMKKLLLLLHAILLSSLLMAQAPDSTVFMAEKQRIDSLVQSIDSDRRMTHILSAGTLLWGEFKANCYYMVGSNLIYKMECFFSDSTAGNKVFYYNDNAPVQIIDKGTAYYLAGDTLYNTDGRKVKSYLANDIVFFSKEVNRMMRSLIE